MLEVEGALQHLRSRRSPHPTGLYLHLPADGLREVALGVGECDGEQASAQGTLAQPSCTRRPLYVQLEAQSTLLGSKTPMCFPSLVRVILMGSLRSESLEITTAIS